MKILALDGIAAEGIAFLEEQGFSVERRESLTEAELVRVLPPFAGLLVRSATKVTAAALEKAVNLQVIGRAGVGVDNIDLEAASRFGVQVVNAPNGNTLAAAEHTMALILSLARNLPQANSRLKQGHWDKKGLSGIELAGKVLSVFGLGRIGSTVAMRAQAFGMRVIGYDPYLCPERMEKIGVTPAGLEDALRQADFVTVHLPLTAETRHLLGAKELSLLKPQARVINAARGGIIDEDALYQALLAGRLAGAALDVFEQEPATAHQLFTLDNVIVTPHLGASTKEAQSRSSLEVAQDLAGYLRGQAPVNPVNRPVPKMQNLKAAN
ncbi:MAG: hydroxyacid dehydrogenase [bacterium]|jgi:D-3-phosphoglycerate dehydrogenase